MAVTIKVEAYSDVDAYVRYHGKAVDQDLDRRFWETQPEKVVGTKSGSFVHEEAVDLDPGHHYGVYGSSAYLGYEWHAKIFVDGDLVAEGDVNLDQQLRVGFEVEALTYFSRVWNWLKGALESLGLPVPPKPPEPPKMPME